MSKSFPRNELRHSSQKKSIEESLFYAELCIDYYVLTTVLLDRDSNWLTVNYSKPKKHLVYIMYISIIKWYHVLIKLKAMFIILQKSH